jgi:hypothetical protein
MTGCSSDMTLARLLDEQLEALRLDPTAETPTAGGDRPWSRWDGAVKPSPMPRSRCATVSRKVDCTIAAPASSPWPPNRPKKRRARMIRRRWIKSRTTRIAPWRYWAKPSSELPWNGVPDFGVRSSNPIMPSRRSAGSPLSLESPQRRASHKLSNSPGTKFMEVIDAHPTDLT